MADSRVIHVDIQGQRYAIKTALEPKYVHDVAAYVDQKMERVGRELSTSDAIRLAVMGAQSINVNESALAPRWEFSDSLTLSVGCAAVAINKLGSRALLVVITFAHGCPQIDAAACQFAAFARSARPPRHRVVVGRRGRRESRRQ